MARGDFIHQRSVDTTATHTRRVGFSTTVRDNFTSDALNRGATWYQGEFYTTRESTNAIRRHEGFTGTIAVSFSVTGVVDMAFNNYGNLILSFNNTLREYSGFSSTELRQYAAGDAAAWIGMDWMRNEGHMDVIGIQNVNPGVVTRFVGFSSTIRSSFTTALTTPRGLAWDGVNVAVGDDGGDGKVTTRYEGLTATVKDTLSQEGTSHGGCAFEEETPIVQKIMAY